MKFLLVISLDHLEIFNVFHSTHIGALNNNTFFKFVTELEAATLTVPLPTPAIDTKHQAG